SPERDTELVVDCVVRPPMHPPESLLVQVTRFGTVVAQTMASIQTPLNRLRLRAIATATSAPAGSDGWLDSIELNLYGEGERLRREDLERLANEVGQERSRWRGPAEPVAVLISSVEVTSTDAPKPAETPPPPPPIAAPPPPPPVT